MNNPVVAAKFEVDFTRYIDPTGKLVQELPKDAQDPATLTLAASRRWCARAPSTRRRWRCSAPAGSALTLRRSVRRLSRWVRERDAAGRHPGAELP